MTNVRITMIHPEPPGCRDAQRVEEIDYVI